MPAGCAARPEPVDFSPGDLPALRAAGARYLGGEPSLPVRITGAVVRLRRSGPRGSGVVRLRVLAGAEVPHVRMELDEEAYRIAGHAHLVGLPIRVVGRLESRGGFRRLSAAREVTPVQVDDAERDRLMKSLQENLDFFEEACGADADPAADVSGPRYPFRGSPHRLGRIVSRTRHAARPLRQEKSGVRRPCDHPTRFRAGRARGDDGHYGRRALRR